MARSCSVLGCPSVANTPSHRFPKNPEQFKIWKETIWSPKISDMSDSELQNSTVCYRHFKDSDYLVGYRLRLLKKNVVPSLNLPDVYLVYEEGDKFVKKKITSVNSVDAIETDCNMQDDVVSVNSVDPIETYCNIQKNVMSVNSVDPIETDCNAQMSVNESNANGELLNPTMPKRQKLELLEKNSKNIQKNVMSVNSVDPIETDCNAQMSVNESNANGELLNPTMPKRQKLELLEKNSKKADLKPKAKSSMAKSLRRRQISTMKYSK